MAYVEIDPRPGQFLDETPRVAKDFWADAQLIRWVRGKLQPVGGWAKLLSTTFSGIARGIAQWTALDGTNYFAIGTHTKFYVGTASTLMDVTPHSSSGVLGNNPIATTISSTSVQINHTSHGLVAGQRVLLLNADSVGGVTVQGYYTVATVPNANAYTITHSSAAIESRTGGGAEVLYAYELAAGNQDGSSSTDPRIVTVDNWGEYALFNPRGGGLYEYQLTEVHDGTENEFLTEYIQLVTNGNFDVDQSWTKGSGWSISGNQAVGATVTGELSQALDLTTSTERELQFKIPTLTFGTFRARYNSSTLGSNITANGTYQRYFTSGTDANLVFDSTDGGTATVDSVRVRRRPRVKNGDFIDNFSTGPWTGGTGWSHDATNYEADAAAGSASSLTQSVTSNITAGRQYIVVANFTVTAGTVTIKYNSVSLGAAISATGVVTRTFVPTATGNLEFAKDSSFAGSVKGVQIYEIGYPAQLLSAAPARVDTFLVTPENFILTLGCTSVAGTYDPLLIRCCSQGDNTDWTPSATNSAKEFPRLTNGSKIIRGVVGRLENLIFTDTALFSCRFNSDANVIYAFDMIADNCGLVGPNAVAVLDGVVYWLSTNGRFYRYAGGQPEPLECPIRKHVWDSITANQKFKIAARSVAQFGEVWWHYPRTGNTENSHYVKLNARENGGLGAWDHGSLVRTVGEDVGPFGYPLACDASGYVQQHENGQSADGSALSWYAQTGYRDIASGNNQMDIFSFVTDWDDQGPSVDLSLLTRDYPNSSGTTDGPYSLTTATEKTDLRSAGREVALKFAGSSTTSFARIGACRLEVQANGERL